MTAHTGGVLNVHKAITETHNNTQQTNRNMTHITVHHFRPGEKAEKKKEKKDSYQT